MDLTVLAVPDCPNVMLLEQRLAQVIEGRRDVIVSRQVIADQDEAARWEMHGSPTILVDGIDPFADPGEPPSVSCRLYRDDNGQVGGAPSVTQLRQAIGEAAATATDAAPQAEWTRSDAAAGEGKRIPSDDPVAVELLSAVRAGDVAAIQRLLRNDPALASARLVGNDGGAGTPLHLVTDWPGYFPNGPEIVRLLIDAGADPNALTSGRDSPGPGDETPLHYAASSDDVDVAEALIEGGANIETPGGSIGTPLDNAIGYGCWHVARLLVTRGARVDKAWHAAALGMLGRLAALLGSDPSEQDASQAFWHACAAGQRRAAEHLLSLGADLNWEPDYAHGTPLDAASGLSTRQENVISWLRERGARSSSSE